MQTLWLTLAAAKTLIMRNLLVILALFPTLFTSAQRYEQKLDAQFKPTGFGGRYAAITEKKDSGWHRTAVYLSNQQKAMEGWYEDEHARTPHGPMTWFHPNGTVQSVGIYAHGKKEGIWKEYYNNGALRDSAFFAGGNIRGLRLQWRSDSTVSDSTLFDERGNGSTVSRYRGGALMTRGQWVQDTAKQGRWLHYFANGQVQATEDYQLGKRTAVVCYDSTGQALANCEERMPQFAGGLPMWRKYLERNLDAAVPVDNGAAAGAYTVLVQFIVNKDGSITDVTPLTNHGYGMEQELVRLIRQGPKWEPAYRFGSPLRAYQQQPVTFVVQESKKKRR